MNRSNKNIFCPILWGFAISLGYVFIASPSTANPLAPGTDLNLTTTAIAQTLPIDRVELLGNTVLAAEDLAPILQPLQDQNVTPEQITAAAEAITQLYISQGYITSFAEFDPQNIVAGVAQIQAIEGELEGIEITGIVKTKPDYVRSRLALGITQPFNANRMEDRLRLLQADPIFSDVNSRLRPGNAAGKSLLIVEVTEAKQFSGSVSADNYSPVSVGSERFGTDLIYRNLTGIGDAIAASYHRSTTGGSNLYDVNYSIPINPMQGTIALRYAFSNYRITEPDFAALNINGSSNLYDIVYRQPLIRKSNEEFDLSLGFTHQTGQTFLFENLATPFGIGPDENGVSTTSVFRFGQDYTHRDNNGAWSWRSQFKLGVDLFDATFFTTPDASFFSWSGQAQRVQLLGSDTLLITSLDTQLSADPLLASQQFTIGGGQSLRGFRQNVRSGDNGIKLSLEARLVTLRDPETNKPMLQIAPFVDLGTIWNDSENPIPLASQNFLAAGGVGLILEPIEGWVLRLDAALPFVNLQGRGDNLQDAAVYFSSSYQF
jgi:hemolysin activation/secretion protein